MGALSLGVSFALARLATTAPDGFSSVPLAHWTLLFAALAAVLTSWEAYFLAIERFPLEERARCYVDVLIVLGYVGLSAAFQDPRAFLWCLTGVFALYACWDALTWAGARGSKPPDASPNTAYSLAFALVALFALALPWSDAGLAAHAAASVVAYRAALLRKRAARECARR